MTDTTKNTTVISNSSQFAYEDEDDSIEEISLRESLDNQHWVQELFPPAFGFTVDEILADIGKKEDPELSAFEKYANRARPLDPSAIKNVYERVWLMQSLQRDELRKFEEQQEGTLRRSFTMTRGSDTVELRHADTSTADLESTHRQTIQDECIWSSSEISVLREVFQAARLQSQELKARLAEVNDRYGTLNDKHRKQQNELESTTRKLNEAIKANKRLHILSQNLNSQLKTAHDKINFLRSQIETFKEDRETFQQHAHECKMQLDKERLEKQSIQLKFERQSKEAARNQMIHEEQFKASHEQELNKLRMRMRELEVELETERKEHERSKRGLEHLRTHFASLPYSGDITKTNMVVEDQLKKWSI